MVLEKTLENPLDCKEIQPVHPNGEQSWVFIGRTDVEAETPILWPPPLWHGALLASAPDLGRGVAPLGCAKCAVAAARAKCAYSLEEKL